MPRGEVLVVPRLERRTAVDPVTGCWRWTGAASEKGYGRVWWRGRTWQAHRLVYTLLVGPIPPGLTIDHVAARGCVYRNCVNPAHLEPVTQAVNVRRGRRWAR